MKWPPANRGCYWATTILPKTVNIVSLVTTFGFYSIFCQLLRITKVCWQVTSICQKLTGSRKVAPMNMSEILSLVINNNMKQIIDFKTTSTSIHDLILTNSDADIIHAERDSNFTENFSNQYAVVFELAFCTHVSKKQLVFYSYCRCDFDSLNKSIALDPFNPICYCNPDVHVAAWYEWFFDLISQHAPRRTIKRQNIQPWITPPTVHFINRIAWNGSNEIGRKELGRPFWSNNLGRIDWGRIGSNGIGSKSICCLPRTWHFSRSTKVHSTQFRNGEDSTHGTGGRFDPFLSTHFRSPLLTNYQLTEIHWTRGIARQMSRKRNSKIWQSTARINKKPTGWIMSPNLPVVETSMPSSNTSRVSRVTNTRPPSQTAQHMPRKT